MVQPGWRGPQQQTTARPAALRILAVALFLLVVAAGLLGEKGEPLDNILPVTVWVIWWVGLTYVCALLGDVWRIVNPLATMALWTASLVARLTGRPTAAPFTLPAWIGIWPAVIALPHASSSRLQYRDGRRRRRFR